MPINKRIKELISILKLSSSEFADEIEVQRSSISHITSGRNKPSLDFIEKLINRYPDLQINWLIQGKGHPFSTASTTPTLFVDKSIEINKEESKSSTVDNSEPLPINNTTGDSQETNNSIDKIVIFYTDGTFKSFNPK